MRKAAVVVVLAVAVAVAVLLLRSGHEPAPPVPAAEVGASTQSVPETAPPPRGARVLHGTVSFHGAPAGKVTIRASDPSASTSFAHRGCSCADHCKNELLMCGCQSSARTLLEAFGKHQGDEPLLALVQSGADGSFELSGLPDGPVTVWADLPGEASARPVALEAGATSVELTLVQGVEIRGSVNERTEKLAGVKVNVLSREHPRWFQAVSGAEGQFHLEHLPPGAYVVVADAGGGRLPALSFAGEGSSGETWLTTEKPQTVVASVVADGAPAHGAQVVLTGQHEHVEAVADAEGRASFPGLLRVPYRLDAELRGLHAADQSDPMFNTVVELVLTRTATLSGVVTRDGKPAAGANVYAALGSMRQETTSDGEGKYTLRNLMPGEQRIGAFADKVYAAKEQPITFSPGAERTANLALEKNPALTGTVVDAQGKPIAGAMVQCWMGPIITGLDVTAADGTFAMIAEGDRELQVNGNGKEHLMQVHAPADVRVQLGGGPVLTATVRDDRGGPVEGAEVRLTPKDFKISGQPFLPAGSGVVAKAVTGRDGVATLEDVDDGAFLVQAFARPIGAAPHSPRSEVTIAGKNAAVTLVVERGLSLEGRVETAAHEPIEGAQLTVRSDDSSFSEVKTTSNFDGHFAFEGLAPGGFRIEAKKEGFVAKDPWLHAQAGATQVRVQMDAARRLKGRVLGDGQPVADYELNGRHVSNPSGEFELDAKAERSISIDVKAEGFRPLSKFFELEPGTDRLPDLVLEHGRTLKVTVLDEQTGLPLSGVSINTHAKFAQTGASGQVTLTELPDGDLEVSAHPFAQDRAPVEVTVPAGQTAVTIKLPAPSKITGKVTDDNGNPIADERVTASTREGHRSWSALTAADGTFKLEQLPEGDYAVYVDDDRQQTVEVDLALGASAEVTLKAKRLVAVQLTVDDAQHRSLSSAYLLPGDVALTPDVFDRVHGTLIFGGTARAPEGHYTLLVLMGSHDDPGQGAFTQPVDLRLPSAALRVAVPPQLVKLAR